MKGWTEDEFKDKNLMAPCGLYCGTCGVYIATRDNNAKFKSVMGGLYGTTPEQTECRGCMQPDPPDKLYLYCQHCDLRNCIRAKGYYACHQCGEWPCDLVENFGLATGKRRRMRSLSGSSERISARCSRTRCGHFVMEGLYCNNAAFHTYHSVAPKPIGDRPN
jgi:hypothetical protein